MGTHTGEGGVTNLGPFGFWGSSTLDRGPGLRDLQYGAALDDLLQSLKNEQLDLIAKHNKHVRSEEHTSELQSR